MNIAIIGAGLAGLAAAQRLRQAGHTCVVFEKSLGVGGRMATRRSGEWQFDHGAQYFNARGAAFQQQLRTWREECVAAEWFPNAFVGAPGMNAPLRSMARGMEIVAGCEVTRLRHGPSGWTLHRADAAIEGAFDGLIVAIPAPQANALLEASGIPAPTLAAIRYAPCWAVMLGFGEPPGFVGDYWRPDGGPIAWIARDGAKPRRSAQTLVIHASPQWSRDHLEDAPEDIIRELLPRADALVGTGLLPTYSTAHRWRYALVERALGTPCLWRPDLGLGLCGDWCLGPRVECAFDSGVAVAQTLLESFS